MSLVARITKQHIYDARLLSIRITYTLFCQKPKKQNRIRPTNSSRGGGSHFYVFRMNEL